MNSWIENLMAALGLDVSRLSVWLAPVFDALQPWLDDGAEHMQGISAVPVVVWAGLALWGVLKVADAVHRWGGSRTLAYWCCGALGAALVPALNMGLPISLLSQNWLFDLALGWVLFTVGQRMDTRWLLRNPALAATAVLEFALTAAVVLAVLLQLGVAVLPAALAAVLAAHSAPVVLAGQMPQWQADGQLSARAWHLGGINTLLAALCMPLLLSLGPAWQQGSTQPALLPLVPRSGWELAQPLMLLLLSLAVGLGLGRMLVAGMGRRRAAQHVSEHALGYGGMQGAAARAARPLEVGHEGILLVAAACVCVGLAQWWGAPAWAACLALGLGVRDQVFSRARMGQPQGQGLQEGLTLLAQMLLFVFSGACLLVLLWHALMPLQAWPGDMLTHLAHALPLVALLLLLRLSCKLLACTLMAPWSGLRWQQGFVLGLVMQPLSMTGLALLLMAWPVLMMGDALLALALALILVLSDWIAPWALRLLLQRAGEIVQPHDIEGLHSRSSTRPVHIDTALLEPLPIQPLPIKPPANAAARQAQKGMKEPLPPTGLAY